MNDLIFILLQFRREIQESKIFSESFEPIATLKSDVKVLTQKIFVYIEKLGKEIILQNV